MFATICTRIRIAAGLAACFIAERICAASGFVTPFVRANLLAERAKLAERTSAQSSEKR